MIQLGAEEHRLGPGDGIFAPRGVPHANGESNEALVGSSSCSRQGDSRDSSVTWPPRRQPETSTRPPMQPRQRISRSPGSEGASPASSGTRPARRFVRGRNDAWSVRYRSPQGQVPPGPGFAVLVLGLALVVGASSAARSSPASAVAGDPGSGDGGHASNSKRAVVRGITDGDTIKIRRRIAKRTSADRDRHSGNHPGAECGGAQASDSLSACSASATECA